MVQKFAAVAAVMISLISVFVGVSMLSCDASAEDSVSSDPFIQISDDDVSFSVSDDGSVVVDVYHIHSKVIIVDADTVVVNTDELTDPGNHHHSLDSVLSVTNSLDESSIEGDFVQFVSDDQAIISNPGGVISEVVIECSYSPNNVSYLSFIFMNLDVVDSFDFDLANGFFVEYLDSLSAASDPDEYYSRLINIQFLSSGSYPLRVVVDASFVMGSSNPPIFMLVSDGSVGDFDVEIPFSSMLDPVKIEVESVSIYSPSLSKTFHVFDSSDFEDPADPEPEDPALSGDAPVADSEIVGIPGTLFWVAAGLVLLVIVLAVLGHAGGRRR